MACRCSEIRQLERDLSLLGAIGPLLVQALSIQSGVISSLKSSSASLERSVFLENMGETTQLLGKTGDATGTEERTAQSQSSGEVSRLNGILNGIRMEDRRYHEQVAAAAAAAAKPTQSTPAPSGSGSVVM